MKDEVEMGHAAPVSLVPTAHSEGYRPLSYFGTPSHHYPPVIAGRGERRIGKSQCCTCRHSPHRRGGTPTDEPISPQPNRHTQTHRTETVGNHQRHFAARFTHHFPTACGTSHQQPHLRRRPLVALVQRKLAFGSAPYSDNQIGPLFNVLSATLPCGPRALLS